MASPRVWLPLLTRVITVLGLAGPALEKFLNYGGQVEFFTRLGIPLPGIMVILSGVTEMVALVLIASGTLGRLAALALIGNMLVAIMTAGLNLLSGAVTLGAAGVAMLGTGRYSLWQPESGWLARWRR
jgi:uncharacterized membrane protein YphA (DoxX/SURF4 family)